MYCLLDCLGPCSNCCGIWCLYSYCRCIFSAVRCMSAPVGLSTTQWCQVKASAENSHSSGPSAWCSFALGILLQDGLECVSLHWFIFFRKLPRMFRNYADHSFPILTLPNWKLVYLFSVNGFNIFYGWSVVECTTDIKKDDVSIVSGSNIKKMMLGLCHRHVEG